MFTLPSVCHEPRHAAASAAVQHVQRSTPAPAHSDLPPSPLPSHSATRKVSSAGVTAAAQLKALQPPSLTYGATENFPHLGINQPLAFGWPGRGSPALRGQHGLEQRLLFSKTQSAVGGNKVIRQMKKAGEQEAGQGIFLSPYPFPRDIEENVLDTCFPHKYPRAHTALERGHFCHLGLR